MNFDKKCSAEMERTNSINLFDGRRMMKGQPLNIRKEKQISVQIRGRETEFTVICDRN